MIGALTLSDDWNWQVLIFAKMKNETLKILCALERHGLDLVGCRP